MQRSASIYKYVERLADKVRSGIRHYPRIRYVCNKLHIVANVILSLPRVVKLRIFKVLVDTRILPCKYGLNKTLRDREVVCSLTSYGRRVGLVHYTVASLLMQRLKPDRVILWLDRDQWDETKIPQRLRRLMSYGLTVKFCENMKSYKKLLPSLKENATAVIVTADDDMFYPRVWLEWLYEAYKNSPDCVYCFRGDKVGLSESGEILPYLQWDLDTEDENTSQWIMPVGCLGVLYPPGSLHDEVNNLEKIFVLSPRSDDIWFWAMSVRKGVPKAIVRRQSILGRRIRPDICELYDTHVDKLANFNVLAGENDVAMRNVINYNRLQLYLGGPSELLNVLG